MNGKAICSILKEYGLPWAMNRSLYSIKLKMMNILPKAEVFFEKGISNPKRLDLFQIDINCLEQFIRNLPERDRKTLIKIADDAANGKILGFSSIELDYGYPINWQFNPLTQKECDIKKKWYQIPDFDSEQGDIKVIWEISRFSQFVTLSRAYLLTQDEKYYRAFSEQLDDWLEKNPYPYGVNFKCGQECALRMVNAMLAYTVFKNCRLTTETDLQNVRELVSRCYRKILSNFFYAYRCIKNNHTLSELLGMVIGAWCCEDRVRLAKAFKLLDQVIEEQFTEDGGYIQYSFNYERLALQDLEVVLAIERKAGLALKDSSKKRMLRAAELMYQCQDQCGDMPNYGSNDGALVYPLTCCRYRDFRPAINAVHVLLTGDALYDKGKHEEELIWLGINDAGIRRKLPERESLAFEQAGLFTIRNADSWLMIVLNKYHSRPAHMDQLHIDLWVHGINVLCDGGTFSYADETGKKLVLNESHNTAVYEKVPQMNTEGAFMIYDWTSSKLIEYSSNSFCGMIRSKNGYSHKRKIKTGKNIYQIWDQIKGKKGERFEIRFHTPCEILKDHDRVQLLHQGKTVCTIRPHGIFRILETSRSLYYLKEEKLHCIAVMGVVQEETGSVMTEITIEGVQ